MDNPLKDGIHVEIYSMRGGHKYFCKSMELLELSKHLVNGLMDSLFKAIDDELLYPRCRYKSATDIVKILVEKLDFDQETAERFCNDIPDADVIERR